MVQIDVPAAFIASQFFLDIGKTVIKKHAAESDDAKPATYYKFLYRSLFFAGAVIAPAGIFLLAAYPGWEQIYWTRRVEFVVNNPVNSLIPALFVMFIVLGGYLGHVIGYRWIVTGKEKYLRPCYLGLLAAVALLVLSQYPSFIYLGTYDQYHNLNGQVRESMAHVWNNPHGFSISWIMVMCYFAVPLLWLIVKIRNEVKSCG